MRLLKMYLSLVSLVLCTASAPATEARNVILDQFGSWRMFQVLKTPEIAFDDGAKPVVYPKSFWLNGETAPAPAGWTKPDFDDADWLRGPIGMQSHASFVARICLRGRFLVSDPAQGKSLKLAAGYHGGITVYLNGEEIGRKDIVAGASLAEAYPLETFVTPKGEIFGTPDKPDAEDLRRTALRQRAIEVELPARLLRKGVNVLAIEIVRSPYHKVVDEKKKMNWTQEQLYWMAWNTCELIDARLTADGPSGVEALVAWPPGLQVWNGTLLRTDFKLDSAGPGESLRPIRLSGARNGVFSDKVVVGSAKPIRGLKAVPSELRGNRRRHPRLGPAGAFCCSRRSGVRDLRRDVRLDGWPRIESRREPAVGRGPERSPRRPSRGISAGQDRRRLRKAPLPPRPVMSGPRAPWPRSG